MSADLPVQGSVAMLTRRRSLAGLLAADRRGCWRGCSGISIAARHSRSPPLGAAGAAGAGDDARHRPGQGRSHFAPVGRRQCRHCRPGDAQRRGNGARRIQFAEHPASGERRRRLGRRRAASRAASARRRCRTHPRAAVRAVGQHRRADRALAQHSGHRLFDRRQCGVARHLSAQLPSGIRCRAHRAICRLDREAFLRGAHSRQSLWNGGRSGVPAGCRAPRRPVGRARALPA